MKTSKMIKKSIDLKSRMHRILIDRKMDYEQTKNSTQEELRTDFKNCTHKNHQDKIIQWVKLIYDEQTYESPTLRSAS